MNIIGEEKDEKSVVSNELASSIRLKSKSD